MLTDRRRGATQALAGFLDLEGRRSLYAHVASHNVASIRVLKTCGFGITGEEPEDLILELGAKPEGART